MIFRKQRTGEATDPASPPTVGRRWPDFSDFVLKIILDVGVQGKGSDTKNKIPIHSSTIANDQPAELGRFVTMQTSVGGLHCLGIPAWAASANGVLLV